jgi:hypothetical protein
MAAYTCLLRTCCLAADVLLFVSRSLLSKGSTTDSIFVYDAVFKYSYQLHVLQKLQFFNVYKFGQQVNIFILLYRAIFSS